MNVFIVDDEAQSRDFFVKALQSGGHQFMTFAGTLEAGEHMERFGAPDVLLLDFYFGTLPNGLHLARHVRETQPRTSIVMVSSYANREEIIEAFRCGADDFLMKPMRVSVLLERIADAYLKRSAALGVLDEARQVGALRVDPQRRQVTWQGVPLALTRTEFTLLSVLSAHPEQVIGYAELYSACNGEHLAPSAARVRLKTHIVNLRHKFSALDPSRPCPLVVTRGVGLSWSPIRAADPVADGGEL